MTSTEIINALIAQNLLWIVGGLFVLCLILLICCCILFAKAGSRSKKIKPEDINADAVIEALENLDQRIDTLQHFAKSLSEKQDKQAEKAKGSLSRIAIERYDAFPDCGGKQSFSAVILDDNSNGLLIRGITSRDSARTYFNTITDGSAEIELSDEDKAAITKANS